MASKYQFITEVYEQEIYKMSSPAEWQDFLMSACRNYKCRFDEQVLIYSQRPDATAVLTLDDWNKKFSRWVNKGANGIAVFDSLMGGHANWWVVHYGTVVPYDYERIWEIFQNLLIYRDCTNSVSDFCRGAEPECWKNIH